jgi:hypothetical protein
MAVLVRTLLRWACVGVVAVLGLLARAQSVRKVHALFMNHLDVGFSSGGSNGGVPGLAATVVDIYFNRYFPEALATADAMRAAGPDRMVYTTKAWLVSLYLDCPPNMGFRCPTPEARAAFEAAIRRGDIQWHAFPFNTQAELMDASLARFALRLSHDLDDRYGVVRKLVWSQRDVPGTTARLLPLLNDAGVRAVSFGVNGASAPAAVPSVFLWRHMDPDTGAVVGEVLALYHPGGYGGLDASDCHALPGWDEVLCLFFKNDNDGPPDVAETQGAYAALRRAFPNATVVASTFEAFVTAALQSGATANLPVVAGELGDTWIHIAGADPLRAAQTRAILAERTACEATGACSLEDPRYYNFSRLFLKAFEHTFGEDVKTALDAQGAAPSPQYYWWGNEAFYANRNDARYARLEASWDEQRAWHVAIPVEALADHPLAAKLRTVLDAVLRANAPPALGDYIPVDLAAGPVLWSGAALSFDPATGALVGLTETATGTAYADATHPWGLPVYQTFDEAAFDGLLAQYMFCDYVSDCTWAYFDFGKVGLDAAAAPVRRDWLPALRALYRRVDAATGSLHLLAQLAFPEEAVRAYGAPGGDVWQAWAVPTLPFVDRWNVSLTWYNKTATRLPEALWLRFRPLRPAAPAAPAAEVAWRLTKLGGEIDASAIIGNGSYHLHAVEALRDPGVPLRLWSPDCALITLGPPNPFPTPLVPTDPDDGAAFNLVNNIWGTNTAMYYPYRPEDAAATFHFAFQLGGA